MAAAALGRFCSSASALGGSREERVPPTPEAPEGQWLLRPLAPLGWFKVFVRTGLIDVPPNPGGFQTDQSVP